MNPAMNTQDILVKIQCLGAGAEKKKKKSHFTRNGSINKVKENGKEEGAI